MKNLSNEQVIALLLEYTCCENSNQLAIYLSEKYGLKISRQSLNQFKKADRPNLTHAILREFIEIVLKSEGK